MNSRQWCWQLLLLALGLAALSHPSLSCAASATASSPLIVTHKLPELGSQERVLHEVEVLQLALEKTTAEFGAYELRGIPPMNRARTLATLSHRVYPNLLLQMSYEDELTEKENLSYIPLPLDLGALSYRLCFARSALAAKTTNITSIEQLQQFTFGVGIGWADGKILRANGLQVIESNNVTSLFRMTKAGRIDFFCRGPMELHSEQQMDESLGLTANPHIALHYPLPKFFFTHKDNHAALGRIQKGLELAYRDGSFQKLWHQRHGQGLHQSNLKQRHIIYLQNPLIKHLPHQYESYLYNPLNQQTE